MGMRSGGRRWIRRPARVSSIRHHWTTADEGERPVLYPICVPESPPQDTVGDKACEYCCREVQQSGNGGGEVCGWSKLLAGAAYRRSCKLRATPCSALVSLSW